MKLGADLETTKKEQQHTICIISKLYVLDLCQKIILTVYLKQKIASPKTSDILLDLSKKVCMPSVHIIFECELTSLHINLRSSTIFYGKYRKRICISNQSMKL
jgi:hypothetical protein